MIRAWVGRVLLGFITAAEARDDARYKARGRTDPLPPVPPGRDRGGRPRGADDDRQRRMRQVAPGGLWQGQAP